MKQAIKESVIPSDSALAAALAPVEKSRGKQAFRASAPSLQTRFSAPETEAQPPTATREISPGIERNRLADLDAVPG